MPKPRTEVAADDRWNVEALYSSADKWEQEFQNLSSRYKEILKFKGRIKEGSETLKSLLDLYLNLDRGFAKLYTYAHLRHDEDVASEASKQIYEKIQMVLSDFQQAVSWVEPEILALPQQQLDQLLQDPLLADYKLYLEKIVQLKPHTLSAEMEELMALASLPLDVPYKAFGAFNNADLKFPKVKDGQGNERDLTHGTYFTYLRGTDRALREASYKAVSGAYAAHQNTLCELIAGQIQRHQFSRKARKYNSCLEAALAPHQIDPDVYLSLIKTVRSRLPSLHRYMKLRKKLLGVAELHPYDMYTSLIEQKEDPIPYKEAEKSVVESVAPLGKEYQETLRKGLVTDRWVDRYENLNKRTGAYSSGCYDSMPYILMNYQGMTSDVRTLAHEAGHSMHTYLSAKNQPYQYSQYSIFLAEIASTFNEQLLGSYVMSRTSDKKARAHLVNQKIDDIRATFFRQVMFAEFELMLHKWAEEQQPITPALLRREYRALNEAYFGPDVTLGAEIEIEWARIPHFYYNFYVYQYATGLSAAYALFEKVEKEGEMARGRYLKLLSSGSSDYPLNLLKDAGVDMRSGQAVNALIDHFDQLVTQLEELA